MLPRPGVGDPGLIPGWVTKISQPKKKKPDWKDIFGYYISDERL